LDRFFKRDFRIFSGLSKGRGSGFSFGLWTGSSFGFFGLVFLLDVGLLDGLTQEYGLVFRTLDLVFQRDVDLVFVSDFGLVLRSDFWTGFSFGFLDLVFQRAVDLVLFRIFGFWFFYRILDTLNSFV
jgi:hypothetical protein